MHGELERLVTELPKVELHLHIEGAIPPETLLDFAKRDGKDPSLKTVDDLRKKLIYKSFPHFIELWTWMVAIAEKILLNRQIESIIPSSSLNWQIELMLNL